MSAATLAVLIVLLLWSIAEAFAWPIVPDAALAAVVFLSPALAASGTLAVVAGTAVGGALAISLHRRGFRWPLPVVTDRMRQRVGHWMDRGPGGLIYQPLTAVPYKVFVVDAAPRAVTVPTWTLLTVVFRGPRMAAVAAVAALAGAGVERLVPPGALLPVKLMILGVAGAVFLAGWRVAWKLWSGAKDARHPAARAT